MSLRVWLPLDRDLRNLGTSNAIVTNSAATINSAGKIGTCYSFAKNAYLDINKEVMQDFNNAVSICFWIKVNSWNTNWDTIFQAGKGSTAWTQYHIGILRNSANYLCWTLGNGSTASNANYQTGNITVGQWTHVTCTYGEGRWATYLNGTLSKSGTTTIVPNFSNITSIKIGGLAGAYKCDCLLNDFRIYDHCLSAAEVKEIAQGLVLHYKLDDMSTTIVEDSSGYSNNGVRAGTISAYTDSPRYTQCMNLSTAASRINCGRGGMMTDSITINFWANLPTIPSALSDTTGFVSCTESGGFRIQIGNNAHLRSIIYINSAYAIIEGETTLQSDTWYMITLIYDRLNSKLYEYLNGEKEAEVTIENTGTIGYNSGNVIWIGAEARSNTSYYNALVEKVSDFRIYCTPLLDTDIKSLYNIGMRVDNLQNIHTFELNENGTNKLTKTGILYDNIVEPYLTLPDGSQWKLLLYHYVDGGNNLFTQSNATYCNDFGLYSRLKDINNYTYDGKYEFYVIQDGIEYRWTQTSQPTASSIAGLTTVSGYTNPVNGLAKANQSNTYIGYGTWWGACGCWKKYSTGGKTGIPGFGSHDANGICTKYLALYARIDKLHASLIDLSSEANEFIER